MKCNRLLGLVMRSVYPVPWVAITVAMARGVACSCAFVTSLVESLSTLK